MLKGVSEMPETESGHSSMTWLTNAETKWTMCGSFAHSFPMRWILTGTVTDSCRPER